MAADLILPLAALERGALGPAGGKAANLGELIRAGFPVPPGFCVTTAAYARVAEGSALQGVLEELAGVKAEDAARLAALAERARRSLLEAPVPPDVERACAEAYRALGADAPVAVRSSATAEDLPDASFAGQQDTFLNVVGEAAVLQAIRRCWASLFTERAVTYRARNGIDARGVRLAVAVQRLVEARVAGVLFTADPLTGQRRRAVIDASPGLGEAVVSGAVNPDHFEVDADTGQVLARRLGDKRVSVEPVAGGGTRHVERQPGAEEACVSDVELAQLAALGARVEAHYGAPQDIEWALDAERRPWLLQARPITTLFPLPQPPSAPTEPLRVYFNASVAQGVYRPLTPMGLQAFRMMAAGAAERVGARGLDPIAGPRFFVSAAGRLFFEAGNVLRSDIGRKLVAFALSKMETRSGEELRAVLADPRIQVTRTPRLRLLRWLLTGIGRAVSFRLLFRVLARPERVRAARETLLARALAPGQVAPDASPEAKLDAVARLLRNGIVSYMPGLPMTFSGLTCLKLSRNVLKGIATDAEIDTILRGLPNNPTTEMDLELWHLAERIRADPDSARALASASPAELARRYHEGSLPPVVQKELGAFLDRYGFRGVAEIDLGMPRWWDDPAHLLGSLANYLALEDAAKAPAAQFQRGAEEAEAMVRELIRRARAHGWLRGKLAAFLLTRARGLAGVRESPKFHFVRVLSEARRLLFQVGETLAREGRLDSPDGVVFLDFPELRAAVAGKDMRALVRERRATYDREIGRKHLPRWLLSDGTEPAPRALPGQAGDLEGTPASAGVVTGRARVVLDPVGAKLEPGEILVAPSTDPGWTPLFLTAGGLVMEMGGAMSHGSVVAREYGIPAVVGVPHATERIVTGQQITVDGGAGVIRLPPRAA